MWKDLLDTVEKEVSIGNIITNIKEIYSHDRWSSFSEFHKTAQFCYAAFRNAGADSARISKLTADGKTRYGDYIVPKAWDAEKATLAVIEPTRAYRTLADYRKEPNSLFMYSAPTPKTGREAEVIFLEGGNKREDYKNVNVRGKIIYTTASLVSNTPLWRLAGEKGAIGIINNRQGGDVGWENYCFVPVNRKRMFGFSLTEEDGRFLEKLIKEENKRGKRVKVKAVIDARSYNGTADTVSGIIEGKGTGEVLAFAHLYEIGAWDNASGAACLLEATRCLNVLIQGGVLARPKRTIRFMLGFECYSLMEYLTRNEENAARTVAGINVDGAGHPLGKDSPMVIHGTPPSLPSYASDLIADMVEAYLKSKHEYPFCERKQFSGCDSLPCDPCFSIPFPHFSHSGLRGAWHTSKDTPDLISEDSVKCSTVAAAAYLYFLANAGRNEALFLMRKSVSRCKSSMRNIADKAVSRIAGTAKKADIGSILKTSREEIGYEKERGIMEIESALRLTDRTEKKEITSFISSLNKDIKYTVKDEYNRLEAFVRATGTIRPVGETYNDLTEMEVKALHMVPVRKVPGILTLETLSERAKTSGPVPPAYQVQYSKPLFWADGKRNLLEIYGLCSREMRNVPLDTLVEAFEYFSKHGYIDIGDTKIVRITEQMILRSLRELGIRQGDVLFVHSSLTRLGYIQGGPETVITSLRKAAGKRGTVVMPVFSFSFPLWHNPAFDAKWSKSQTGIISEVFRWKKGVVKSGHPSHSVAAAGRLAREITKGHANIPPYDKKGPFGKLVEHDAKIIFFGCGIRCNSILHALEDWHNVPYLAPDIVHVYEKGEIQLKTIEKMPVGHRDFYMHAEEQPAKIYKWLDRKGVIHRAKLGKGTICMMESGKLKNACEEIMKKAPCVFLCDRKECLFCLKAKEKVKKSSNPN